MTTATYTDALARYLDFGKRPSPMDLALMVVGSIGGGIWSCLCVLHADH